MRRLAGGAGSRPPSTARGLRSGPSSRQRSAHGEQQWRNGCSGAASTAPSRSSLGRDGGALARHHGHADARRAAAGEPRWRSASCPRRSRRRRRRGLPWRRSCGRPSAVDDRPASLPRPARPRSVQVRLRARRARLPASPAARRRGVGRAERGEGGRRPRRRSLDAGPGRFFRSREDERPARAARRRRAAEAGERLGV